MLYILVIAVSLALDAFAVSVSAGLTVKGFSIRDAAKMGLWFGGFQFIMPLIGWLLGSAVAEKVMKYGPYIACAVLAFIGGRMILGALRGEEESRITELSPKTLFLLAVATSIDALAVGVTFAFMEVNVLLSSAVIGVVAFALSLAGGMLGGKIGEKFQEKAQIAGGIVLIAIGIKMLF